MEVDDKDSLHYLSIKEYQRKTPSPPGSRSPVSRSSNSPTHFNYNFDEVVFTLQEEAKFDVNRIYSHILKQKRRHSFSM